MNRREFIRSSMSAAGGLILSPLLAFSASPHPDLVGVRGGTPAAMVDAALTALGGMRRFVKPNQTVVLKPNIAWDVVPELGANTHPETVSRVIHHCRDAGAKSVYVFDHTCDAWSRSYRSSGMQQAVKSAGGVLVPGDRKGDYSDVTITGGKRLKTAAVHELILSSDVFINIPVLKHHGSTGLTISMKNLMGAVWNRSYWHLNDLHQCIADFSLFRKPDLNIVDAYRILTRHGPRGVNLGDVLTRKFLVASTDIVAADAAATRVFGSDPGSVDYIRYADEMGVGTADLSNVSISRITL